MSEMVERVARVLYERNPIAGISWDAVREEWRELARGHARAAIAAMRIPTDRMMIEFCHASNADTHASWEAMIDEALR